MPGELQKFRDRILEHGIVNKPQVEVESFEFFFDLGAAFREVLEHLPGDARDVGDVVVDRVPFDTETPGEFVAEHRLVERAGRSAEAASAAARQQARPYTAPSASGRAQR